MTAQSDPWQFTGSPHLHSMGQKVPDTWRAVTIAAAAIIAALAFRHLLGTIIPALSLAIVLLPVHRRLRNRVPAGVSAAALTLAIFVVLAGTAAGAAQVLLQHQAYITGLVDQVELWIAGQSTWSGGLFPADLIRDGSGDLVQTMSRSADALIGRAPLFTLEVVFFLSLYLFVVAGERMAEACIDAVPRETVPSLRVLSSVTSGTAISSSSLSSRPSSSSSPSSAPRS